MKVWMPAAVMLAASAILFASACGSSDTNPAPATDAGMDGSPLAPDAESPFSPDSSEARAREDSGSEPQLDGSKPELDGSKPELDGDIPDASAFDDVRSDFPRPTLNSPRSDATFYLHEAATLSGECGDESLQGRFEIEEAGRNVALRVEGIERVYTFSEPGDYEIRLVCTTQGGRRLASAAVPIHVRAIPQLVFSGRRDEGLSSTHVYAVSLDALGSERRISPDGGAYAIYSSLRYAASGDRLHVGASGLSESASKFVFHTCREDDCDEVLAEPSPVREEGCAPSTLTFSPSAQFAWARDSCDGNQTLRALDLRSPGGPSVPLSDAPGRAAFVLDEALLYEDGSVLELVDLDAPERRVRVAEGARGFAVSPDGRYIVTPFSDRVVFHEIRHTPLSVVALGERAFEDEHELSNHWHTGGSDAALFLQVTHYEDLVRTYDAIALAWDGTAQTTLCTGRQPCAVASCEDMVLVGDRDSSALWDLSTWPGDAEMTSLSESHGVRNDGAFSPGCEYASYTAIRDRPLPDTGILVHVASHSTREVPLDSRPIGDGLLLTASYGRVAVRRIGPDATVEDPPLVHLEERWQRVGYSRISPDGKHVVFLADLEGVGTLSAYHLRTETPTLELLADDLAGGAEIAFSPDSRYVTLAGQPGVNLVSGRPSFNRLREYELSSGEALWTGEAAKYARPYFYDLQRVADTRRVLFRGRGADPTNQQRLFSVDVDRGAPILDHNAEAGTLAPVWNWDVAADGSTLALSTAEGAWILPVEGLAEGADPLASFAPLNVLVNAGGSGFKFEVSGTGLLFEHSQEGPLVYQDSPLLWLDRDSGETTMVRPGLTGGRRRSFASRGPTADGHGVVIEWAPDSVLSELFRLDPQSDGSLESRSQGFIQGGFLTPDRRFLLYRRLDGPEVLDLATGTAREIEAAEGVPPSDLLDNPSSNRYAAGRLVLYGQWGAVRTLDLRSGLVVHDVATNSALVVGVDETLSFAVTCQVDERNRAAIEVLDLQTGSKRSLVEIPKESRSCDRTYVSPSGGWVLYQVKEDQSYLVPTDGSLPPQPLGGTFYGGHFDAAERYVAFLDRGSDHERLLVWSLQHPELGMQEVHASEFGRVRDVTWID